jgi:hypothetical protein
MKCHDPCKTLPNAAYSGRRTHAVTSLCFYKAIELSGTYATKTGKEIK